MTALEHLSSLVERSINHKIYHYTLQVIFLTVILLVKQVEKGRMKLFKRDQNILVYLR